MQAREIVGHVAQVVRNRTAVAEQNGARPAEIKRMANAFEHDDLTKALAQCGEVHADWTDALISLSHSHGGARRGDYARAIRY